MKLVNPTITLQSTSSSGATTYNITTQVASVTLDLARPVISRNTFGTTGPTRNKKGRIDGNLTIDFDQDYSSSAALSRVLYSYLIADYPITVVLTAEDGVAVSATNPKYTFTVAVDSLPLFDGGADDGSVAQVTWPLASSVTEATS